MTNSNVVWCVFQVEDYEGWFLQGIFSAEAEANACVEQLHQKDAESWKKLKAEVEGDTDDGSDEYHVETYYNKYIAHPHYLFDTAAEWKENKEATQP